MKGSVGAYDSMPAQPKGLRLALATSLSATALAGLGLVFVLWYEAMFAAPIIFLVKTLGFWPGYLAFVIIWAAMNVTSLTVFDRVWPRAKPYLRAVWNNLRQSLGMKPAPPVENDGGLDLPKNWRLRLVLRAADLFRPLGAVANGLLLGGPLGAPVYRFLGYRGLSGYLWTLALTPVFAIIWVPFYGAGGVKVFDLLQDAL